MASRLDVTDVSRWENEGGAFGEPGRQTTPAPALVILL